MIRAHLTPAEYRRMPWANGHGETLELLRREGAEGQLLLRLSVAQVVENGAFSRLPGIDRVLTVISGPGFDLAGGGASATRRSAVPGRFFWPCRDRGGARRRPVRGFQPDARTRRGHP